MYCIKEKVIPLGIRRMKGFLYFLSNSGVYRVRMRNHGHPAEQGVRIRVRALDLERRPGYLYFIDRDGDITRAAVSREAKEECLRRRFFGQAARVPAYF